VLTFYSLVQHSKGDHSKVTAIKQSFPELRNLKVYMTDFFLICLNESKWHPDTNIKNCFRFRFSFPALLPFKNVKFYFLSCQKPRKRRPGRSHVVTSYQERSRCQNKLRGPHCGDPIHFIFLYSATAKLSTKFCETADLTRSCDVIAFLDMIVFYQQIKL